MEYFIVQNTSEMICSNSCETLCIMFKHHSIAVFNQYSRNQTAFIKNTNVKILYLKSRIYNYKFNFTTESSCANLYCSFNC